MHRLETSHYFANLAKHILSHKEEILKILLQVCSYPAAHAELLSAVQTLKGAAQEIRTYNPPSVNSLAVFQSSNVILYSYVLYGLVPSKFCRKILIRASKQVAQQTLAIHELIGKAMGLNIEIVEVGHRRFTSLASTCDVVVFTGHYQNAREIRALCPNSLFIFFGSGTNPFVVGAGVSVETAVEKSIQARMFNSGQDCMCPNVFFIARDVFESYLSLLVKQLKTIQIHPRTSKNALLNQIYYDGVVDKTQSYIQRNEKFVFHRGEISLDNRRIEPIVLRSDFNEHAEIAEYFSPVFNVIAYDSLNDVESYLFEDYVAGQAMGFSVFGCKPMNAALDELYMVARNKTLFEIENGNLPFGGYAHKVSSVTYKGEIYAKPVLISREVRLFLKQAVPSLEIELDAPGSVAAIR